MKRFIIILIISVLSGLFQYYSVRDGGHWSLGITVFVISYIVGFMESDGDSSRHGEDSSF